MRPCSAASIISSFPTQTKVRVFYRPGDAQVCCLEPKMPYVELVVLMFVIGLSMLAVAVGVYRHRALQGKESPWWDIPLVLALGAAFALRSPEASAAAPTSRARGRD